MTGDDVGVTLGNDGAALVDDLALGQVQAVESLGFRKDRALSAVEILGFVFWIDLPRPESNGLAQFIADRKDQPVAEGIVVPWSAFASLLEKSGGQEQGL